MVFCGPGCDGNRRRWTCSEDQKSRGRKCRGEKTTWWFPTNPVKYFKTKYLAFPDYNTKLRLMVTRTTKIKWVWAATRTWAAAARTMRTTRRKAPGRRKGATRSERRKFSSTVILFCLHTQYTPAILPTSTFVCNIARQYGVSVWKLTLPMMKCHIYTPLQHGILLVNDDLRKQHLHSVVVVVLQQGVLCCSISEYCSTAVFPSATLNRLHGHPRARIDLFLWSTSRK